MTAFVAAFAGLATLLPDWAQDAGLAGFVVLADGTLREHVCWDLSPGEVEQTRLRVMAAERWKAVHLADGGWLVSTAVLGDDGQLLGVLAVVGRGKQRREGAAPDAREDVDALISAVDVVAAAYSRLWRDVLGAAAP